MMMMFCFRKDEIDKLAMAAIIKLTSVKTEKASTSRPKVVKTEVKNESASDSSGVDSELDDKVRRLGFYLFI